MKTWVMLLFVVLVVCTLLVVGYARADSSITADRVRIAAYKAKIVELQGDVLNAKLKAIDDQRAELATQIPKLKQEHTDIYRSFSLTYANGDRLNEDGTITHGEPPKALTAIAAAVPTTKPDVKTIVPNATATKEPKK